VLVLTRRVNQSIMIGGDVVVTVLEVRGDQVRIGIEAPRTIDVHREEVFEALRSEREIDLRGEPAVDEPPAAGRSRGGAGRAGASARSPHPRLLIDPPARARRPRPGLRGPGPSIPSASATGTAALPRAPATAGLTTEPVAVFRPSPVPGGRRPRPTRRAGRGRPRRAAWRW